MTNPFSPEIRRWVEQQVGPVRAAEVLKGSTSTTLLKIRADEDYILRLYDNAEWLAEEPDLAAHEAAVLKWMQASPVVTPELVAVDYGVECPLAVLLMTLLPGEIMLRPPDMANWLRQMAETLLEIHQVAPADFGWTHFRYQQPDQLFTPAWGKRQPGLWQRALDILQHEPQPAYTPTFIHRDYHPTNILWQDGLLSGVVDWVNACVGPEGADVGHMRVNLTALYGVDCANQFLDAYLAAGGSYHPYWDLMSIGDTFFFEDGAQVYPPWLDFGMTELTNELIQARDEALLADVLARF